MSQVDYQQVPEHVRRIIDRDGEIRFTPPSFERWLGRLQMLRTLASMGAFMMVWLTSYALGQPWEGATIRGIIASLMFFFFAWAAGLFIFGEIYDAEVKAARVELEQKERERARRIEEYYRERLQAQAQAQSGQEFDAQTTNPSLGHTVPMSAGPASLRASSTMEPDFQRRAA